MTRVKAAIIRDEGYPIGTPAPCHINCECGERIPLAKPFEQGATCPKCGTIYDKRGWIERECNA